MSESKAIRVMTYNLRNNSDGPPHSWDERKGLIQELIRKENPDIIGTQEGLWPQVQDLETLLPEYGWLGLGREGGSRSEYMTIYYRKSRFEVLEYDHFWLSETPDVIGSSSWGSACTRMVTWVKLLDKETNKIFYHFNTHLDHVSETARVKGAEVIIRKALELSDEFPIILTGDFNTVTESETHQSFVQQGDFSDTWLDAPVKENEQYGSFNGFRDPTGGKGRIDWILSRGKVKTNLVKVVNDTPNGQFPSDHFPVVAELIFEESN